MRLVPAGELSGEALDSVRQIFEEAFSARLRSPFENLLADQMYVLTDGPLPRGFAVLRKLGPTPWIFLRYFAVGPRGQGVGAAFWTQLVQHLAETGYTRIVWDVEDPSEDGTDPDEAEIRLRRIAFYTRLGGVVLPVSDYREPEGQGSHPMLLMTADLAPPPDQPLTRADVRDIVINVYRYRYQLDERHPLTEAALRSLRPRSAPVQD